ncbi:siderophore-iron reductase FhuF [Aidingimonas lacisalsi]|uniref:siderophore-iron reductase FhuF n=1 Tax=Aidingimonas lacisalsi TaxID=2604086 RepID=UPI0011D2881F|nr:siderophore-iron reductase FhuF [Aidingimonas lacisalsi]
MNAPAHLPFATVTTPCLSDLYVGPLESLAPPSIGSAPSHALAGGQLLDAGTLDNLLERFAAQYGHGDRRAIASLWSKWHINAVLAPTLLANLILERELPIALEETHLVLTPEGRTERLCLVHEGTPLVSRGLFARFKTLLDGHLAPLFKMLSDLSGASTRVFWSNAGNVFEHYATAIERHPQASPGIAGEAQALLESRHYPDGRRNPLYRPIRYIESQNQDVKRLRKLCCLRYLLPEIGYCGNCPLEGCDRQVRK